MAILDELIIKLGLEEDSGNESVANGFAEKAKGIVSSIADAAKTAGTLILGSVTGFAAFAHFVGTSTAATAQFAKDINSSFEGLQELRYAAEMSGRSVEELDADLKKIGDAQKAPMGAAMGYRMLGVSLKDAQGKARDVSEVMIDLSGRIKGMSSQRTKLIQDQLGFSDDTIKVLQQGPEALRQLAKEGRDLGAILPESAAETAIKYNETITKLKKSFEALSFRIGSTFLPVLKDGVEWLQRLFTSSQRWLGLRIQEFTKGVSDAFSRVKEILIAVWQRISPATDAFSKMAEGLDMVRVFSNAIVTALAIAAAAFAPAIASALAMTAGIVALGLVVDDLINYFEGGESVIGAGLDALKEKFPAIYNALKAVADFIKETFEKVAPAAINLAVGAFDAIVGTVKLVAAGIESLFNLMSSSDVSWISKYVDVFVSLINLAGELLTAVGEVFTAWANGTDVDWSGIGDKLWEALKNVLVKFGELMNALASGIGNAIKNAAGAALDWAAKKIKGLFSFGGEDTPEEKAAAEKKNEDAMNWYSAGVGYVGEDTDAQTAQSPSRPDPFRQPGKQEPQTAQSPAASRKPQWELQKEQRMREAWGKLPTLVEGSAETLGRVQASQPVVQPLPATATQKAGATVTDNSKREQNNTFNITATDPQGAASAVAGNLSGADNFLQQRNPGLQRSTF